MEAVRVIFVPIQGDYINFTMAAMAAMLNFSAGAKIKMWRLYVPKISYRLLIHMEALRVIFGQIQGDYINFTMAAVVVMLIFFSRVRIFFFTFICPKEYACQIWCWLMQRCVRYSWNKSVTEGRKDGRKDGRTDGRTDGGHSYVPLFAPQMAGDN